MWRYAALIIAVFVGVFLLTPSGDGASTPMLAAGSTGDGATSKPSKLEIEGSDNGESVELTRESDGHFYVDALVNGAPVRFLVDTGASSVALTTEDAATVGIAFNDGDFNEVGRGVGGDVALKSVKLATLSVGDVELSDVDAVVTQSELPVSLLGQTWLSRVANVTIHGDKMVLSQN
jgi:aspartyl protease family protein